MYYAAKLKDLEVEGAGGMVLIQRLVVIKGFVWAVWRPVTVIPLEALLHLFLRLERITRVIPP